MRRVAPLLFAPLSLSIAAGCVRSPAPPSTPSPPLARASSESDVQCPAGARYDGKKCVAIGADAAGPTHGWWCNALQEPGVAASSCSRTREECETERGAMLDRGHTMSACVESEEAVCIVFVGGAWSCMATMDECDKVMTKVPAGSVDQSCATKI